MPGGWLGLPRIRFALTGQLLRGGVEIEGRNSCGWAARADQPSHLPPQQPAGEDRHEYLLVVDSQDHTGRRRDKEDDIGDGVAPPRGDPLQEGGEEVATVEGPNGQPVEQPPEHIHPDQVAQSESGDAGKGPKRGSHDPDQPTEQQTGGRARGSDEGAPAGSHASVGNGPGGEAPDPVQFNGHF